MAANVHYWWLIFFNQLSHLYVRPTIFWTTLIEADVSTSEILSSRRKLLNQLLIAMWGSDYMYVAGRFRSNLCQALCSNNISPMTRWWKLKESHKPLTIICVVSLLHVRVRCYTILTFRSSITITMSPLESLSWTAFMCDRKASLFSASEVSVSA